MKKTRIISLALASLLSLTTFTACASSTPKATYGGSTDSPQATAGITHVAATNWKNAPAASKARTDTLVVGTSDMTGVWNKEFGTNAYDWYVCDTMFDYMVNPTADGKPESNAVTYHTSANGLVYTFDLKKGIKYWDGHEATASDLEFWYYVLSDPKFDGAFDLSTVNIKGFAAYKKGSAKTITGIKVVNKYTLQVTLTKPSAPAIWSLNIPLMEKAYYAPNFKKGDDKAVEKKLSTPMGTGPYKFVSFSAAKGAKLVANDAYFLGKPKIKNLQFVTIAQGKELQALQTGIVDVSNPTLDTDDMTQMKSKKFIDGYYFPVNAYGEIQWNIQDAKYKDVRVRQALTYALDRTSIVKAIYGPYAVVNNLPLPTSTWAYSKSGLNTYAYNLGKARTLLTEAGWAINPSTNKLEKGGKTFTINFTMSHGNAVTEAMLPVMKQAYAKLGITVNIQYTDWGTLYNDYTAGKLDAVFLANNLSTPDPDQSTQFLTKGTQNYYKYSNKSMDKLLNQELVETNQAKRTQEFYSINKILNTDLPVTPIYQRNDFWTINGRVNFAGSFGTFRDIDYDIYKWSLKK
jgi:ABC-type dipeptide transport system, periplasmic component